MASVTGPQRPGRPAGRAARTTYPGDGEDEALRAELERRIDALRAAALRVSALAGGDRARAAERLLARIDAQQGDWLAAAPGLMSGRPPAAPARLAQPREHQRALRKLAVLRADVLHVARHAG